MLQEYEHNLRRQSVCIFGGSLAKIKIRWIYIYIKEKKIGRLIWDDGPVQRSDIYYYGLSSVSWAAHQHKDNMSSLENSLSSLRETIESVASASMSNA